MVPAEPERKVYASRMAKRAQFLEDNWYAIRTTLRQDVACPGLVSCLERPRREHNHGAHWHILVRFTGSAKGKIAANGRPRRDEHGFGFDYWSPKGDSSTPTPDDVVTYLAHVSQMPNSPNEIYLRSNNDLSPEGCLSLAKLRKRMESFFTEQEMAHLQSL